MRIPRAVAIGLTSVGVLTGSLGVSGAPALAFETHAYLSQFTGASTPGGSFSPLGVAANESSGNVYITDNAHKVVDVFNASGTYQTQLKQADGVTPYAFGIPWGVTVNQATGQVYVLDAGTTAVVDVFTSAGVPDPVTPQIGKGTISYYYARSVAVNDATGEVYVADSSGDKVFVFSSTGTLLSTWTGAGTPAGSFGHQYVYVGVDQTTHDVYVADTGDGVVDKLAASGAYLSQFTIGNAAGVSVDPGGDVYVTNQRSDVVEEFSPSGSFLAELSGTSVPGGTFGSLQGVAIGSGGKLYVADSGAATPAVDIFGASPILLPDVTSGGASSVTRVTATLNGTVNPDGASVTSCQFEYGTSVAYGHTAPCAQAPGSGSSPVAVSAEVSGLQAETTYHYRLAAGNSQGVNPGTDMTFTTPTAVEGVVTDAATELQFTSVTVNGSLEPNGFDAHDWFEYGPTSSYGASTPHQDAGSANGARPASAPVTGLESNTTYHFRLVAENTFGITHGSDETVTTKALAPEISELPASSITRVTATVSAKINPQNSSTKYRILYGTTSSYGEHTVEFEAGAGHSEVPVNVGLQGLAPETTYHYAVAASNLGGTTTGLDQTLTTGPPTPPTATTGGASNITLTSATVAGTINPRGLETSYELDFGTDANYGTSIYGEAGSATESINIAIDLLNLAPGTTYHYRIVAINSDGRVYGADQTLTTPVYSNPIILPSTLPLIASPAIAFPTETEPTQKVAKKKHKHGKKGKVKRKAGGSTKAKHGRKKG